MKKYLFVFAACTMIACGGSNEKENTYQSVETLAEQKLTTEPAQTEPQAIGKELIAGSDCVACHREDEKLIGPAYQAVAQKYEPNDTTITFLANKIIKGGSGNWGDVPMTPHPQFTVEQAEQMARYILSLE